MRKKMFIILLAMVIIFALTSALCAQETDPVKVLNALGGSLNAGDLDTAMTLYAPDAVIHIVPPPAGLPGTYTGLKEIRGWLEVLVGMNFKIEGVEILKVEGNKLNVRVKSSSDFARGFNIAFLEHMEEHIIQDGKIKGYTTAFTPETMEKLQAAMTNQAEKEKVLNDEADALNAGDVDATMALYTDDVIFKFVPMVPPPGTYIGAEQVRLFMEDLVAGNFKMQFEILQVLGDTAVTRIKTWMDPTIQLGIAPMEMIVVYHIEDGKIKSCVNIFTDESLAKLQAAMLPSN